jgi:chaperonin GroEL (HSP60 family)
MLKMLLDPMGGIVLTNDGNAILREVSTINNMLNKLHLNAYLLELFLTINL